MANKSNGRAAQIRRAARNVAIDVSVGRSVDRIANALERALLLVDARPDASTGERDEHTADLDELTQERDAARAEAARLTIANASQQDEIHSHICNTHIAERRAEHAETELEKTRALAEELRAQLVEPTVQSAAVKRWLAWSDIARWGVACALRYKHKTDVGDAAADVLDSLSMQAPAVDLGASDDQGVARPGDEVRAGVPTEAAEEVERLMRKVASLEACNERQRLTIEEHQKRLSDIANRARGDA